MDIRKFFGKQWPSRNTSALSQIRESRGSPINSGANKKIRRSRNPKPQTVFSSTSESDEDPVPKSLRQDFKQRKRSKKIILSSDEEGSASNFPVHRQNIVGKSTRLSFENVQSHSHKQNSGSKPEKKRLPNVEERRKDLEVVITSSDDETCFVPSSLQSKRTKFSKMVSEVEDDSKILQPIDEALFFSKFPRSSRLQVPPEAEKLKRMTKAAEDENQKSEVRAIKNEDSSLKSVKEKRLQKPVAGVSKNLDLSVQESIKEQSLQTRNKVGINNKGEPFEKKNSKDLKRSVCHSPNKYATGVSPKKQCLDYEVLNNTSMSSTRKKTAISPKHSSKGKAILTSKDEINLSVASLDKLQEKGSLPWVDKYKPTSLQHLVGQNGEKSPMNKLLAWLRGWYHLHIGEGASVKKARPPPWLSQSDGSSFKAVLLSGVPGVGKTTCAIMACKELNLEYVEMNASEVRNKKNLEATVAELIGCRQMDEFFGKKHQSSKSVESKGLTHVLIMDEVDGMSGNEDRAGIAELIQMIKTTRIPIICICNDRQSQKMRTLIHYCFDIRFQRPRVEQIKARMLTIACQEKFAVSKELLDDIIEASNHDVRQTIYNLQLLSYGGKNVQSKDCAVNVFEAARRLLSAETSLIDKQRMFFTDYTLMPLFVQENYPNIGSSKTSKYEALENLRRAADCISLGDIVDKSIRSAGTWSLLNELSMFSSALPAAYMNGHLKVMINFPSWLGKTSSTNKRFRLLRQLSSHCYSKIPNGHSSLNVDYISFLRDRICWPLVDNKVDGISSVIATYNYYNLLKIDAEAIVELAAWPGMKDPASKIEPKVKAALTRALNKEHRLLPYVIDDDIFKKRRGNTNTSEMALDEEGNVVDLGNSSDDSVVENDENEEIAAPLKAVVSKGKNQSSNGREQIAKRGRGRSVKNTN